MLLLRQQRKRLLGSGVHSGEVAIMEDRSFFLMQKIAADIWKLDSFLLHSTVRGILARKKTTGFGRLHRCCNHA
jgi:hypothetical protein